MNRPPKLKPLKQRLIKRILAMPVPGVLDLTGEEWIPSDPWLRKIPGVRLSRRFEHDRKFLFRIG